MASSYAAAAHLQHLLLRAGYQTGIDEGNRWIVGEGPVWRVQTSNPAEHPVSRTRRIENDEEDVKDQLESVYKRRPQRCFSLVWRQKSQGGYSANDISVLSSAAVIHRNGG